MRAEDDKGYYWCMPFIKGLDEWHAPIVPLICVHVPCIYMQLQVQVFSLLCTESCEY